MMSLTALYAFVWDPGERELYLYSLVVYLFLVSTINLETELALQSSLLNRSMNIYIIKILKHECKLTWDGEGEKWILGRQKAWARIFAL